MEVVKSSESSIITYAKWDQAMEFIEEAKEWRGSSGIAIRELDLNQIENRAKYFNIS